MADGMKFVVMEEAQRNRLIAVAKRLYTENRLNGDEMRDLAHTIMSVVNSSFEADELSHVFVKQE